MNVLRLFVLYMFCVSMCMSSILLIMCILCILCFLIIFMCTLCYTEQAEALNRQQHVQLAQERLQLSREGTASATDIGRALATSLAQMAEAQKVSAEAHLLELHSRHNLEINKAVETGVTDALRALLTVEEEEEEVPMKREPTVTFTNNAGFLRTDLIRTTGGGQNYDPSDMPSQSRSHSQSSLSPSSTATLSAPLDAALLRSSYGQPDFIRRPTSATAALKTTTTIPTLPALISTRSSVVADRGDTASLYMRPLVSALISHEATDEFYHTASCSGVDADEVGHDSSHSIDQHNLSDASLGDGDNNNNSIHIYDTTESTNNSIQYSIDHNIGHNSDPDISGHNSMSDSMMSDFVPLYLVRRQV